MITYIELTERIIGWAEATEAVRAALMIGSRARVDHPADAWSDLDVLVFTHNPNQFIESADWAAEIAPYWLTFVERAGDGGTWERRTLYEDGLDVDIALNPAEWLDGLLAQDEGQLLPVDVSDMIRRGVKILVDKDGKLAKILVSASFANPAVPQAIRTGIHQCRQ